jgi:16S rRNA processing protein RimM
VKEQNRVVIGRIIRPHGISGEVRVRPYTESGDSWETIKWLYLNHPDREETRYRLIGYRFHQRDILLELAGVVNRDQADELKGYEISVPRSELPEPEEGEYYWADLIGLTTMDENGRYIGRIKRLQPAGAIDILIVERDGVEVFIPFQEEVVTHVDLEEQQVVVRLPEGFLEIND